MNSNAQFWDKTAERYARSPVADEAAYQKKLDITRRYFRPGMEVLEFGCGTGSTAIAHAPYVKHIRATDLSGNMINIARGKAQAANISNITFEVADIDTLDAEEASFDAVMAHSILHLLEDKDAVIARVHKLLKPGGVFVSSTVCLGDTFLRYIRFIAPVGRLLGLMPLVRVFTSQKLIDNLTRTGFSIDYHWQQKAGPASVAFIVAKKAQ